MKEKIKNNQKIMNREKEIDKELYPNYERELPAVESPEKKSIFKKIFKGFGYGGFLVGSGIIGILYFILNFLFTAFIGLGMIGIAIRMFMEGSILWGLLVLLVGTPLAIGLAHWLFLYLIILGIFSAILWGIATIFGFDISFWTAWDIVWVIIKIAILGIIGFFVVKRFTEAMKEKNVLGFFKDCWWIILLFCLLYWWFFF